MYYVRSVDAQGVITRLSLELGERNIWTKKEKLKETNALKEIVIKYEIRWIYGEKRINRISLDQHWISSNKQMPFKSSELSRKCQISSRVRKLLGCYWSYLIIPRSQIFKKKFERGNGKSHLLFIRRMLFLGKHGKINLILSTILLLIDMFNWFDKSCFRRRWLWPFSLRFRKCDKHSVNIKAG